MANADLRHLAIIPDGNRRWSIGHGVSLERTYFNSCAKMLDICKFLETIATLREVSLFFVSLENLLSRTRDELDPLFSAGHHFLDMFYESSLCEAVDLRWVGMHEDGSKVDSDLYRGLVHRVSQLNPICSGSRRLNVVMGYDVRRDIETTILQNGSFSYEYLTVNRPVDLIVRSGGRQRLSGFLPLMCQYSEFDFIEELFPDVTLRHITDSIRRFRASNRRFGS